MYICLIILNEREGFIDPSDFFNLFWGDRGQIIQPSGSVALIATLEILQVLIVNCLAEFTFWTAVAFLAIASSVVCDLVSGTGV